MATKDYAEILLETIDRVVAERFSLTYSERSEEDYEIVKTMANPYELVLPDQVSDFGGTSITVESGKAEIGSFNFTYKDDIKYDRLIIQCELTVTGTTSETTTNSYGIQVEIKEKGKDYIFQFDSSEMLGNPLAFDGMLQRKICDLGEINSIDSIKLTFYNNTNKKVTFSNIKGTLGYALEDLGEAALPALLWSDVKEYHTSLVEQKVYDLNSLNISLRWIYDNGNTKKVITSSNTDELPQGVCIYWYKYTPNVPQGSDNIGGSYFSRIGTFDGSNRTDPKNGFTFNIFDFIETIQDNTQIKVVICYTKEGTLTEVSSNVLKIANIKDTIDGRITGKQIKLEGSTSGVYPFYAYDKIYAQDKIYEINKERKAVLDFDCQEKESKADFFKDVESITWYIPNYNNEKALLLTKNSGGIYTNQLVIEKLIPTQEGYEDEQIQEFCTLYYKLPERAIDLLPNKLKAVIKLKKGTEYEFLKDIQLAVAGDGGTDNSIIIRLYLANGNDIEAIKSGIKTFDDLTLLSGMPGGIDGKSGPQCLMVVSCYDFEGNIRTDALSVKAGKIYCSVETETVNDIKSYKVTWNTNNFSNISKEESQDDSFYKNGFYCKQMSSTDGKWLNKEEIFYLKSEFTFLADKRIIVNNPSFLKDKTITIQKIEPLAYWPCYNSEDKSSISDYGKGIKYIGPTHIKYNYEGQLISNDFSSGVGVEWDGQYNKQLYGGEDLIYKIYNPFQGEPNKTSTNNQWFNLKIATPYLALTTDYKSPRTIAPAALFEHREDIDTQGIIPYAIYAYLGLTLVYVQPIVIEQDVYFSRLINEWDQALKIDEANNAILSASLVAGTKDIYNKFTGIVAGDIGNINTEKTIKSGLFGYHAGVESFGFNTDGTAFLGQSGAGRINFNGKLGVIYSGNFDPKGINIEETALDSTWFTAERIKNLDGTYLNLNNGLLFASDGIFKGSIYAAAGSNIAGWVTTTNIFGKITTTPGNESGTFFGVGLDSSTVGTASRVLAIGSLSSLTGSWAQAEFYVTGQGKLYAADAEIGGTLTAGPGSSIGGWTISSPNGNVFGKYNEKNKYGIAFDLNQVGTENRAFAIGKLSGIGEGSDAYWGDAAFYVTGLGEMKAAKGAIAGFNFDSKNGFTASDGIGLNEIKIASDIIYSKDKQNYYSVDYSEGQSVTGEVGIKNGRIYCVKSIERLIGEENTLFLPNALNDFMEVLQVQMGTQKFSIFVPIDLAIGDIGNLQVRRDE